MQIRYFELYFGILNRKVDHLICLQLVRIFVKTFLMHDIQNPSDVVPLFLTLPVPILDEERKLTQILILTILCGPAKGFMKALKAFIKLFEAPQKNMKIKISVNFYFDITSWNARAIWQGSTFPSCWNKQKHFLPTPL